MTERERLLEKLGKVKALADRGEGGEKESAERTLAALMKRYGITEEDLEDTKATIHWIRPVLHEVPRGTPRRPACP